MSVQVLNTLYVTVPESYLRLENDTLRIEVEKEVRLRVPPHHLGSVVCFGHVGLSAPLMHRLAEEGIALVLLDDRGRFKARWKAPWRETFCCGRRSTARGEIPCSRSRSPRACVAGKIRNGRQVLLRGAREIRSRIHCRNRVGAPNSVFSRLDFLEVRASAAKSVRESGACARSVARSDRSGRRSKLRVMRLPVRRGRASPGTCSGMLSKPLTAVK